MMFRAICVEDLAGIPVYKLYTIFSIVEKIFQQAGSLK